jgi:hypothetical protein
VAETAVVVAQQDGLLELAGLNAAADDVAEGRQSDFEPCRTYMLTHLELSEDRDLHLEGPRLEHRISSQQLLRDIMLGILKGLVHESILLLLRLLLG